MCASRIRTRVCPVRVRRVFHWATAARNIDLWSVFMSDLIAHYIYSAFAFNTNWKKISHRWLSKIPGDPFKLQWIIKLHEECLFAYLKQQIALHAQTLDPINPRDYIDAFLAEKHRLEKMSIEESTEKHYFTGIVSSLRKWDYFK